MLELNRRSFMRGVAALAAGTLVPTLRFGECHLQKLLLPWVDRHGDYEFKYDMRLPFVVDGKAYGTDGRGIAEIIAEESSINHDCKRKLPDVVGVFGKLWKEGGVWHRLPTVNRVRHPGRNHACPACLILNAIKECNVCEGFGEYWRDEDGDVRTGTCPGCHGLGVVSLVDCRVCHGRAYGTYNSLQTYGDQTISVRYDYFLRQIPGVQWCRSQAGYDHPILWQSDIGIRGMVMPVIA